jgi:putative FmdB family regulatory protein
MVVECIKHEPPPVKGGGKVFAMPTYVYRCKQCKKEFEIFHRISTTIRKCPDCGGVLEKLIAPNAGLIFKGSGFYSTDYKRGSNGNGNGKGKGKKAEDAKTDGKEKKE